MKKRILSIILLGMASFMLYGCEMKKNDTPSADVTEVADIIISESESESDDTGTAVQTPAVPPRERLKRPVRDLGFSTADTSLPDPITYPADLAVINGSLSLMDDGAVGRFEQKDKADLLEFIIDITEEGFYLLTFDTKSFGGYKENYLTINGEPAGALVSDSEEYAPSFVKRVHFDAGENRVGITAHWGWIAVKSLTVSGESGLDEDFYEIPATLVNPNADDNALGLMSFLVMQYGLKSLAGQQSQGNWRSDHGLFGGESQFIYEQTGKRPAVIGLDFINYSASAVNKGIFTAETEAAIEAWENNAIVTFAWHWRLPKPYTNEKESHGDFYTSETKKGIFKKIMDGDDPDGYQFLLDDIDIIAVQLKRLQDAGVPVLWRPLHEASGGWFWWGTDKDSYLKLWKLLFDRLNNHHNLTNLIWVWNGQHKDWYPGDEYVDIIGEDIYAADRDYSSQSGKFFEIADYSNTPKLIALTENGVLFDPEIAKRDGAMWSWWCVWNGEFVKTEQRTEFDMLRTVYDSEYVLTHEDLPDLKNYPIYVD